MESNRCRHCGQEIRPLSPEVLEEFRKMDQQMRDAPKVYTPYTVEGRAWAVEHGIVKIRQFGPYDGYPIRLVTTDKGHQFRHFLEELFTKEQEILRRVSSAN